MARSVKLRAELEDERIVVTMPGTTFRAIYYKNPTPPAYCNSLPQATTTAAITHKEFEALAWKAANENARELGWNV